MGTLNCCLRSRLADLVIRLFFLGRRIPLASRWNMRRTCPRQVGSQILLHPLSLADNTPPQTRSPTTRGSIACRNRSLESGEKEKIVASCAVISSPFHIFGIFSACRSSLTNSTVCPPCNRWLCATSANQASARSRLAAWTNLAFSKSTFEVSIGASFSTNQC